MILILVVNLVVKILRVKIVMDLVLNVVLILDEVRDGSNEVIVGAALVLLIKLLDYLVINGMDAVEVVILNNYIKKTVVLMGVVMNEVIDNVFIKVEVLVNVVINIVVII